MTRHREDEEHGRGSSRRRAKEAAQKTRVVKDKFQGEREAKAVNILPKNENQRKYIELLKTKTLVVAKGSSGTGKTWVSCTHAANRMLRGEIERIVLIRPYESVGKSIGMRPGTGEEKLLPLMQSMIQPLQDVFGKTHYEYLVEHQQIVLEALEDVRGRSYRNSVIVCDEAQNADIKTVQTLVTRIGEGSQLVLCGDGIQWQTDIKSQSGLEWLVEVIKKVRKDNPAYLDQEDINQLNNNIGVVTFTRDDVVRSGLTRLFVKIFDEESTNNKK